MGLFDDIGKDINNAFSSGSALSDVGNAIGKGVQVIGNFFGFNNRASWQNNGGLFKWIDEGFGELTGRNQSRASLNFAKDQQMQAEQQANDLLTQQRWNQQQADIAASDQAKALSQTSDARSGINFNNATPLAFGSGFNPASQTKDFLGL